MKINVTNIVKDHFSTLYDGRTGKTSVADWCAYVLVPIFAGALTLRCGYSFRQTALGGMLTAYSIFAGLLLNLLVLVSGFTTGERLTATDNASKERRALVKELYFNLSFAILLSIANVVIAMGCLAAVADQTNENKLAGTHPALTFVLSAFSSMFMITLLQVLKRIHAVLAFEFNKPVLKKTA